MSVALVVGAPANSAAGGRRPSHATGGAGRHRFVKPPTVARPSADVRMKIDVPTIDSGWTLRVLNESDVPVRLIADTRFLSLDVTPRSAPHAVRCELPPAMRPDDPLERAIVLPPHRAFRDTFDAVVYCFGPAALDALSPGATVVAHLGPHAWSPHGPSEVSPIDGVEPVVAPTPVLEAPPVSLPDERPASSPEVGRVDVDGGALDVPRLALEGPRAVDAASPEEIDIPITLRNNGSAPVIIRFRPETVGFDVESKDQRGRCVWPTLASAATRESMTTLAPEASAQLTLLLSAYCSSRFFTRATLLTVRPWLDTRGASAASLGVRAFDGSVVASSPVLVRLQRGTALEPLVHPHTEEP